MTTYLSTHWIFALGFLAQSLFASRIVVQWWASEKSKEVTSPGLFWKLSMAGSALFLIYGALRLDIVIILGQAIGYYVYIRNFQLRNEWRTFPASVRALILTIPIFATAWIMRDLHSINFYETVFQQFSGFLCVGLIGQWLLNFRFLYQLYYAERKQESLLSPGFWWISLVGAVLILAYAIYRSDPVLLLAQGMASVPYARNIVLSKRIQAKIRET